MRDFNRRALYFALFADFRDAIKCRCFCDSQKIEKKKKKKIFSNFHRIAK